ncbi:MAG: hypothetical protein HQK55_00795 [Deltaproteobacteria bacterium]|nr:hypothetical protein [Deltaproteobacteria bacterium]
MPSSYAIGAHFEHFIRKKIESDSGFPADKVFDRLEAKYSKFFREP